MEYTILNNKISMPFIGLGAYRMNEHQDAYNSILTALELGYRHIDTASFYKNEEMIGQAISDSRIDRKEIFLTTKIWTTEIRNGKVSEAFQTSLRKLNVDYVDLYLLHWPVKERYVSAWSEMEDIYKKGLAKSIGISNYTVEQIKELMKVSEITPMVNQFEIHPYFIQEELIDFCIQNGIQPVAHSPLCSQKNKLLEEPILKKIAKKYSKTPAQIVLRWNIERGVVAIPKSSNGKRQAENLNVFDFSLLPAEILEINSLNKNMRLGSNPNDFPY